MRKLIQVLVCVITAYCIVSVFNMAYAGVNKDTGEVCQGSDCSDDGSSGGNANVDLVNKVRNNVDIVNKVNNNIDIVNRVNNDITNRNSNTNTNKAYGGRADANAKASAVVGDITNKNIANGGSANIGDITNKATGGKATATGGTATIGDITNKATGGAGGDATATAEGGKGGKGGKGGDAKATAGDNKGNNQTVNLNYDDKPDLIDPPDAPVVDTRLKDHADKMKIKTMGSVISMKVEFTEKEAEMLGRGAKDVKVEYGVFVEYKPTNKIITDVGFSPSTVKPMGVIYIMPSGPDCTLAQMEGKLMEAAMKIGASFIEVYNDKGAFLEGSSWSLGFGGGASVSSSDGTSAIAPSGGTGFGKAKSNNEMRPALMAKVYGFETQVDEMPYIPMSDDDEPINGRR